MAFDMGFDFRGSTGFVTDPTYGVAVIGETYPHTYTNGAGYSINAGWDGSNTVSNRTSSNDARIAGANYISNDGVGRKFKVDLGSGSTPGAGSYMVDLAMGDSLAGWTQDFRLLDTSTVLIDGTNGGAGIATGGAGHFIDATLTDITASTTWTGTAVSVSFATTQAALQCGSTQSGSLTFAAHFRLTLATATAGAQQHLLNLLGVGA